MWDSNGRFAGHADEVEAALALAAASCPDDPITCEVMAWAGSLRLAYLPDSDEAHDWAALRAALAQARTSGAVQAQLVALAQTALNTARFGALEIGRAHV